MRSLAQRSPFSTSSGAAQRSGVLMGNVALPGGAACSPSVCLVCSGVLAGPDLSGFSLAFQVEPGVQSLGPASEGHENFPPKNAVTDPASSHQIKQLVSCDPDFAWGSTVHFLGVLIHGIQAEILGI